ncbi:MAG TPA: flavin reductase family protein, partial [Bacillota bacterium]|nr:flavin reductase family protein [Bacillota bacterium]
MDEKQFRKAMSKFATGVTVITIEDEAEIKGMTVNAFMSISLEPKMIAVSIGDNASLYDKLLSRKQFGLNILTEDQKDLSLIFSRQKEQKEKINFDTLDNNPIIKNSLASLSCYVKDMKKAGDHMILIAEVTDAIIT